MGVHKNIGIDKFPEQSSRIGKTVKVCFHYDADKTILGEVVRDDNQEPFIMIFKLADCRYVLSTECQYSPII